MEIVCKRYTEIPHTSRLFSDFLYHFDRVEDFYTYSPLDPASFAATARSLNYPDDRRRALVAALSRHNPPSDNLSRLARSGTVAVVTGQQVGILSGPAYTIYKALTAVRLANQLTESGIEAVPIFWLATEDHDLAEVSTAWNFNAQHEPVPVRLPVPEHSVRPVGNIPISDIPLRQMQDLFRPFPHGEEISALLCNAYLPGRTYGESFRELLSGILSRHGLLFFDPMEERSRQLAAPFLAKAVEAAPELTQALLERNKDLAARGYHAQVHVEPHTSLFFLLEGGERITLRRKNGTYTAKDRRLESSELIDKAASLSPNAALRPVVQDFMIPTVAYIGGPAELAYLAQSAVIYRQLLGRMPVAVPRGGFTLVDDRSRKLMERYNLQIESFFHGEEQLQESIASQLVPAVVKDSFGTTTAAVRDSLAKLRHVLQPFDSTLSKSLDKSTAKMNYQLQKMERKVARESLRRNERAQEEARYLSNLLYPHKHLQERFYTILPFLARHGMGLLDTVYDNILLDCPDHHILYL